MRLWSLNPRYLDQKGLCGLWRKALQAQAILTQGRYKIKECPECHGRRVLGSDLRGSKHPLHFCYRCQGNGNIKIKTPYHNHPQMSRFKNCKNPMRGIGYYLVIIWHEANKRGYKFDFNKIKIIHSCPEFMTVTRGQLKYERQHLIKKLIIRNGYFKAPIKIEAHPLFTVVDGDIESWEKVK